MFNSFSIPLQGWDIIFLFVFFQSYSVVNRDSKVHNSESSLIIIIIINSSGTLLFWEIFTPALADGFLLESECQQVSSVLQDCPQYSG